MKERKKKSSTKREEEKRTEWKEMRERELRLGMKRTKVRSS